MNIGQGVVVLGIVVISLLLIGTVLKWNISIPIPGNGSNEEEWAVFQPLQCQEIPWRKAWAQENNKNYGEFPLESELEYIKTYYAQRLIRVKEVRILYDEGKITCDACGCEETFSFALRLSRDDAAVLLASGFTLVRDNPTLIQQIFGK